jgi:biopolymer transport protein ExbD
MRLVSRQRGRPGLEITPLVDVLFILIVFVTLAARFDRPQALGVDLPTASAAPAPPDAARVVISADGALSIDGQPIADAELEARLRALRSRSETLTIAADATSALARATLVLERAAAAGFTDVAIATEPR